MAKKQGRCEVCERVGDAANMETFFALSSAKKKFQACPTCARNLRRLIHGEPAPPKPAPEAAEEGDG